MSNVTILPERSGQGRLGAHLEWDPQSEAFLLPAEAVKPRSVKWERRAPIWDQGDIGCCVGNGTAGVWASDGKNRIGNADLTETDALRLYEEATRLDDIPGHYSPGDPHSEDTGSTTNAGMKALRNEGVIVRYHWARSLNGLVNALQSGPVSAGLLWRTRMDYPRSGLIRYQGEIRGGHCVVLRWVDLERGVIGGDNSWGDQWGNDGSFEMSLSDWQRAFADKATVTFPVFA